MFSVFLDQRSLFYRPLRLASIPARAVTNAVSFSSFTTRLSILSLHARLSRPGETMVETHSI